MYGEKQMLEIILKLLAINCICFIVLLDLQIIIEVCKWIREKIKGRK